VSLNHKGFRILSFFTFFLTVFINVTAQFTTHQGRFGYALNSAQQVFALSPDQKLAVSLENDPVGTFPALLTSFDPIQGTEFDHKTFGFGPLEVKLAQTSAGLRVVVLTSEGGPRRIYLFSLSPAGQLTQLASTQLTDSNADAGSNMVLSTNADVGFVLVASGELLTFSLTNGAILNRTPATGNLLSLSEANGKRVLAVYNGMQVVRFLNLINPTQPVVLGDVTLHGNGELSGFGAVPPVFSGDGKYLFIASQFVDFSVVDVDARQVISTIAGEYRFSKVSLFEDNQHRFLAIQSTSSGTRNFSDIVLVDATDPAHLTILKQFTQPDGLSYKSGEKFSKNGTRLFVQTSTKLIAYDLPAFAKTWEKVAPQGFQPEQLEVYGDDEVIAAWEAFGGLGFVALFGAFPGNLPDVTVNDVTITEGDVGSTNADFSVTLSSPSTHRVTVGYSTSDGTATQGTDYVAKTGSVVFEPGETSKTVSVAVLGDTTDEFSETFKLNLNSVDVGTIVRNQGTATINSNDPPPTISVADTTLVEGDSRTNNAMFVLTLSKASEKPISIDYATADGTALAGSDYVAASGTISFSAGQTTANVSVPITPDPVVEPDETLVLNLSNPVNATISRGQASATITNDDEAGIKLAMLQDSVNEAGLAISVLVLRKGDLTVAASVDYKTEDAGTLNPCNSKTGQASSRCDYVTTLGTLQFAPGEFVKEIRILVNDDGYLEGPEVFNLSLSNALGATLLAPSTQQITILDFDFGSESNPSDIASFFVRQHYLDFLNREGDNSGRTFWINEITSCNSDPACVEVKRINVSAAFFLSVEFQETGYLVYRTYKTAFGNLTGKPVPIRFLEFLRDTQQIGRGVQVGVGDWQAQLETNKQSYALAFVQSQEFLSRYPTDLTADQFVSRLDVNAGGVLSDVEKANLVAILGVTPADSAKRASVLRSVAEDADLRTAEFNKAFVLMQYFGYLRRNPDEAPDTDFAGYNFWLNKLNQFNGNFVQAELVKAFITSAEYRQRFGPLVQ